jgi:hypothetical protein
LAQDPAQRVSGESDAKFMVNVGDLVDYGQLEIHWNAWFAARGASSDTGNARFGNHEHFGSRDDEAYYWAA